MFFLRYKRHGGSGTNLTHTDIMEFDLGRVYDEWKWLIEQWESENKAIEAANRKTSK